MYSWISITKSVYKKLEKRVWSGKDLLAYQSFLPHKLDMQIYSISIQGEQILKFPSINAKGRMNFHSHVNKQKNPQNIFPLTKMLQRRTLTHFPSCSI